MIPYLPFWRRIKYKLLLFGIIMSIVPISVFGWYNIQVTKMALEEKILERQISVVQRAATEINYLFHSIQERMALIIDANDSYHFSNLNKQKWEQSLYSLLKQNTEIENAYVFDKNGKVLAGAQRLEVKPLSMIPSDQLFTIRLNEDNANSCFVGDVHFKEDGQPFVNICVPFRLVENDTFNGGMLVEVNLRSTFKKISTIYSGKAGYVYLIDNKEKLIAHTDFSHVLQEKKVIQSEELKKMLDNKNFMTTPTHYKSYTGESVIGASAPIPMTGWAVVVEQPIDQAYASVHLLIKRLMFTTFIVVMTVVLLSIIFGVWFTKPIELMEKAVRKVTQGTLEAKIDYPVQDEFGRLAEAFNHMTSELKTKSDNLLREKERLDTIINGSGAGFALVNKEHEVVWMNHRLENWLAKDQDYPTCYRLLGRMEKPCQDCPITLKDPKYCHNEIINTLNNDGRTKIYRHRMYPLEHTDDGNPQYLIMVEDITEQRQLEEMAVQADKLSALGILASGFAHEVNNPLATISAYAEDLKERMKAEPPEELILTGEIDHYMDIIHQNVERCKTITSNLLHFSRKSASALTEVELNKLIDDSLMLFHHEMKKKQIQLLKQIDSSLPSVLGDSIQIQQVLVNLIQNAIDAVNKGGKLEIYSTWTEEKIELHVKDNGAGMTKEQLHKAFDPFYTTKPAGKGTGLGLYISYNIMKKMNGDIIIQSEENIGTDIALIFPLKKANQEAG